MAAPAPAPRRIYQTRSKLTALPLYYEGFLWIKRANAKETKYWTELRGTKLFLYNDKKQEMFTDKIDLQNMMSVADQYSVTNQWTGVVLTLENEEVHIRTELTEEAEEWKGFILTVVEMSVPNILALLPGQLIRLKEVLDKETSRRASEVQDKETHLSPDGSSEEYESCTDVPSMPLCFHNVTRAEAAEILTKTESLGSLILRPGGGAETKNYAISIRENSEYVKALIKHYRVISTEQGYTIELDKPVVLKTLQDVVDHFVKETRGKLKPLITHEYEAKFEDSLKGTQKTSVVSKISPEKTSPAEREKENIYMNVTTCK
ncbi:signal-transducing adaptor 1 [Pelobates cultripes]|uniref:Signal-transducing adaptor 1 n=1 Tax=Pelobates cultripes TaxID=61616 RepID=A0AAD1SHG4_PELCU|nr:signal-transducing adaptor 1 [Pelobates cultripes]